MASDGLYFPFSLFFFCFLLEGPACSCLHAVLPSLDFSYHKKPPVGQAVGPKWTASRRKWLIIIGENVLLIFAVVEYELLIIAHVKRSGQHYLTHFGCQRQQW